MKKNQGMRRSLVPYLSHSFPLLKRNVCLLLMLHSWDIFDWVLPTKTNWKDINGSASPSRGITVLLNQHLATAASVFSVNTAVDHEVRTALDNKLERKKVKRWTEPLMWQPECLLRGKWQRMCEMESPSKAPRIAAYEPQVQIFTQAKNKTVISDVFRSFYD